MKIEAIKCISGKTVIDKSEGIRSVTQNLLFRQLGAYCEQHCALASRCRADTNQGRDEVRATIFKAAIVIISGR